MTVSRQRLLCSACYISSSFYRPQRSFGKVMFLPPATKLGQGYVFTGVCDSVHRGGVCLSACYDTTTPLEQTHTHPEQATPLRSRHPPEQTPPAQSMLGDTVNRQAVHILLEQGGGLSASVHAGIHPPPGQTPLLGRHPPGQTLPGGHYSGRYASYWNAFLLFIRFSHYHVYLQETTAIDGRAWALAELPMSVPQFDTWNNQQGPLPRAEPPLVVTQHMEPTRRFVLLNSQVSIPFLA